MNSGYVGYSMSIRANHAYNKGLLPKAKIKKSDLTSAGIDFPVGFIKWLMQNTVKPTEWHHTGKHFNETGFYDLEDVKNQLDDLDIERLYQYYQAEKQDVQREKGYYALIQYGEWSGSRNHPKLTHYEDYAYIKGNWAYISADKKKKVTGKHYEEKKTFKIKPKEMTTKTRDKIFKKLKLK